MSESLWVAVDTYLKEQLLAELGSAGDYSTLQVQNVYVWAQTHPSEWANLQTPFQVIMSFDSSAVPAGHDGESTIKRQQSYQVVVLSVVDGTAENATRDAKILAHRTEKLLATLRWAGITADDGSKASRPRAGNRNLLATGIELYPRPSSSQPDSRYGVAVTAFTVTGLTV